LGCECSNKEGAVKEILRLQTRGFDKLDTYGRYLAEKGLRTAIARRRKKR
jgi:predicted oxidoreductase